jgi:hypothetical protein
MSSSSHVLAEALESETTSRSTSVRGAKDSNRGLICSDDDCFIQNDDITLPPPRAPALAPKAPVRAPTSASKAPVRTPMTLVRAPNALALAPGHVNPILPAQCIGDAAALRTAISRGDRVVTLCYNSLIVLSNYIDLSRKMVEIHCAHGLITRSCHIMGNRDTAPTRLFWGNSVSVKFRGITFSHGNARGNGGAFALFGGKLELDDCGFESNTGAVRCFFESMQREH